MRVRIPLQSLKFQIPQLLQARRSLMFRQLQSVDSLSTYMWHDKNYTLDDHVSFSRNFVVVLLALPTSSFPGILRFFSNDKNASENFPYPSALSAFLLLFVFSRESFGLPVILAGQSFRLWSRSPQIWHPIAGLLQRQIRNLIYLQDGYPHVGLQWKASVEIP